MAPLFLTLIAALLVMMARPAQCRPTAQFPDEGTEELIEEILEETFGPAAELLPPELQAFYGQGGGSHLHPDGAAGIPPPPPPGVAPTAGAKPPQFPFQNMFGGNQQQAAGATGSTEKPFGGLFEVLNYGQPGSATAGGAGTGAVDENGNATGQGTGIAQAGQGGFGIGLGIGGAIATPLGNLSFGQGASQAVGK